MRFLFGLVKNPFTLWFFWLIQKNYLELTHWNKKVQLGYLTNIRASKFGGNNKLYDYVRLWYSSIDEYTYGEGDRGASIRIPVETVDANYKSGYLEDRRPASNANPYEITKVIIDTLDKVK